MKHFQHNELTSRENTPTAWLRVGSEVGSLLNRWAMRDDLAVRIARTTSAPVAALFNPASAEIEISIKDAFGEDYDPNNVGDYTKRRTQLKFAKATGAMFHEACHARFTQWSLPAAAAVLTNAEFGAMHILEEGRIESFGARAIPNNRTLLRTCALEIVLGDLTDESLEKMDSAQSVAHTLALTYARVDAGVLEMSDVSSVVALAESVIGADTVAKLREIWIEFQAHADHANALPLYELTKKWVAIIAEKSEEMGEEPTEDGEPSGEGEPGKSGEGKGKGKPTTKELIEQIREALEDARDNATIESQDEIDDQMESADWEDIVSERNDQANERKENQDAANEVFGKGSGPTKAATSSRLVEKRQPTSSERIAAVQIAKALQRAKYRERTQIETNRELPPGRLRSRAVVQREALKANGVRGVKSEPFRSIQRKHTDSPELKIGVMVDISGSMRPAMQPMAVTAWALSEATRRVDGKCAMVYFGNDVFATLKPGQHLKEVAVYSAADGTESFDKGFKALDGSLGMVSGQGARLLVVVSDGQYTPSERTAVRKWLKRCKQTGVAVLWISYGDHNPVSLVGDCGKVVVLTSNDTSEAAREIGKAAISAINATNKI